MAAVSLNANTAKKIGQELSDDLVRALNQNTAALLTIAVQLMRAGRTSISEEDAKEEVLRLFNQFAARSPSQP